jgi:DNA-binding NarL/FixJ family response regulator
VTHQVLLVDDHELVRSGLRRAFELADDFSVVGESGTVADALHKCAALRPDVATLDVRLPDGDGLDLARQLRAAHPGIALVILTMYPGDDQLLAALESGANAFVAKSAPVAAVVSAARQALADSSSFASSDLAAALRRRDAQTDVELSPRELEVLRLLAAGYSVSQVSRRLGVSDATTKTHVSRMYQKLGAGNRAQALMTAIRLGIIDSPDKN